jgi:uncharacterized RDD family membrane protein YckC
MSTSYPTPPPAAAESNWGARLVAAIIDSIPFSIIAFVIFWATGLMFNPAWTWLVSLLIWPLVYGVLLLIYSVVLEGSASSATLGKKLLKLQVQTVNGGKPNSGQLVKRNLSKILWIIFLIDIILGVAKHGADPRQRYFDRFAGTTVVSTTPSFGAMTPPPPPPPPPPM